MNVFSHSTLGRGLVVAMLSVAAAAVASILPAVDTAAGQAETRGAGLPIDALAETAWVEEFDVSPDRRWIAYKSAKAGTYDIWVAPVARGEPTQLTRMSGREMAPKFSPDSRWVAFKADFGGVNVRDLYIVRSADGEAIRQRASSRSNSTGSRPWSTGPGSTGWSIQRNHTVGTTGGPTASGTP